MYGPPVKGADSEIGNLEAVVVAYCTQPRNGARLIPDGTITSAHVGIARKQKTTATRHSIQRLTNHLICCD